MSDRRVCGCVKGPRGNWWKHQGAGDSGPEYALCEPFGGCSHPCNHEPTEMTLVSVAEASDETLIGELVRRGVLVEGGSNQTAAGRWTWLQTESRWLAVTEPVGSVGETP